MKVIKRATKIDVILSNNKFLINFAMDFEENRIQKTSLSRCEILLTETDLNLKENLP